MNKRVLSEQEKQLFLETVWSWYVKNGRHDLPWRVPLQDGTFDPYAIMVSELMLQQTQAGRVIPKFKAFMQRFPNVEALASAPLGDVLIAWQGLGYNRRAKYLWQAARLVVEQGVFPRSLEGLQALPGVGKNTAGAICAYAYNQLAEFIETNVRTVYLHHFFDGIEGVSDAEILSLLEQTIDVERPRDFYWAIMDYGSWLKTTVRNTAQSKHYVRQPKFEGSLRQVRGQVLRELVGGGKTQAALELNIDDARLGEVLGKLMQEGLIVKWGVKYNLG